MKKILDAYLVTIVTFALLFLCAVALLWGLRKQTQSFYFQDETDHVAMGWMMNTFNKNLYTDLSTNHQPIPVYFGAALMKGISYNTLFDLIERIRISMFIFFLITGIGLVLRFRERGLFAFILTFSVGYYFFAWHVLAESIAVPTVIYLVLLVSEKLLYADSKKAPDEFTDRIDSIVAGISLAWVGFCLLPLWPFCALVAIYLFYTSHKDARIFGLSAAVAVVTAVFWFTSPIDWYREAVTNNINYFIAYEEPLTVTEWGKIITFPFLSLAQPFNRHSQMFYVPLVIIALVLTYKFYRKTNIKTRQYLQFGFLYLLLLLLNPRVYTFPVAFFSGFHLFPYVAGFFSIFASLVYYSLSPKQMLNRIILLTLIIPLFVLNTPWLWEDKDKLNEYYVQYGTYESYAQLVKVVAGAESTFFSGPNGHGYLNIVSGVPIAGRQLFHLQWAYRSPQLRAEFHELYATDPPEFIYMTEDTSGYHTDLSPILKTQYTPVLHDNKQTFLYFRDDIAAAITPEQAKYMQEKDFSFYQK